MREAKLILPVQSSWMWEVSGDSKEEGQSEEDFRQRQGGERKRRNKDVESWHRGGNWLINGADC
jgi:hypothetical protein